MTQVLCSVVAPGDPGTVFDYVADAQRHGTWQQDLVGRADLSDSQICSGTHWTEIRKLGSRRRLIDVTVTEATRGERMTFVGRSGGFTGTSTVEFHAEGSRTRIVHRTEVKGRGLNAALVPVIRWHVRRALQANLYRLTLRFGPQPLPSASVERSVGISLERHATA